MEQIWILLSQSQEHQSPTSSLEIVYWEEPTLEDIKSQFHISLNDNYLDDKLSSIIKGEKTKLYGTEFWVQKFTRAKN